MFTREFVEEPLRKAGFAEVAQVEYRTTMLAPPDITELDHRERERLYVEARK